jgi:endonuclease IV
MKIGVKTFNEIEILEKFKDHVDFFEIMALDKPNPQVLEFIKNSNMPIIIHSQHAGFGINNADKSKINKNKKAMEKAIEHANHSNAKRIIVHPGEKENETCSENNSLEFIKSFPDSRIIIENMPKIPLTKGICLGYSPESIKLFMEKTGAGFCLDINHAICSAIENDLDYKSYLKDFIKLKPAHYHLGGQKIRKNRQTHLSLEDSEINIKEIVELLPANAEITLETTTDLNKIQRDIDIIKKYISEKQ